MIDIKDIQGNVILSVPITQACQKVEELMVSDYIQLSWNSASNDELQAGCYIEYNGEKFSLLEPYKPTQKNEVEFTYTPQFKSKVMAWGKVPFFFYTTSGGSTVKEPDWTLTSNPADFMKCVCDALKNETGEDWTYSIDASLPASASLSFSSIDIISALNEIANAFETEWYADKTNNILYLGKASFGESVTLEVGENIQVPSVSNSQEEYYTRFYAFGSTRNITQDYEGSNVNSLVNKRLTLDPAKYPNGYKDIREDLQDGEIFSKVLIFDEVYPSSKLTISDVRTRLMYRLGNDSNKIQIGTDEDGNPIYDQYAIWYFKVDGFDFEESVIIEGKTLSVHFNTGTLSGREFELKYYDAAKTISTSDGLTFEVEAGDYEIQFIEESNYIIPSLTGLVPSEGDEIILFNIEMPSEYTQSAYEELEAELDKEIEKLTSDFNNYTFNSNPVAFNETNPNLYVGRNVTYINGSDTLSTRVIKLTTQLDFPVEQSITIGNEKIKGNTQQLKEEVATANKDLNLLSVFNDMTNSIQQSYARTQQMMLEGFAAIKNIWQLKEDSNGNKYAYSAFHLVTEAGVTMYRDLGFSDIPSLYAGLPIDNDTLYWENGVLKAQGGGGGIAEITQQMVIDALGYTPYSAANPNGYITAASIPSALKSPYALTFGSKTYDGSAAKEITASDLGAALSSDLAKYLPLSGGALTANNSDTALTLKGNANGSWVAFRGNDDTFYGSIGVKNDKTPYFYDGTAYKLWHSGNDGSGSGLDADLLDGTELSGLFTSLTTANSYVSITIGGVSKTIKPPSTSFISYASEAASSSTAGSSRFPGAYFGTASGLYLTGSNAYNNSVLPSTYGNIINIIGHGGGQLFAAWNYGYTTSHLYYRSHRDNLQSGGWTPWKTIAFTDDNVASATKLQTARTIWGQSFDGSGNVNGVLTLSNNTAINAYTADSSSTYELLRLTSSNNMVVGYGSAQNGKNLYLDGCNVYLQYGTTPTAGLTLTSSGNVGIGTESPTNKLHINNSTTNTPAYVTVTRGDTGYSVSFGVDSGGVNRGVWDNYLSKWLLYSDTSKTYLTSNIWINQSAWNNGLSLNRTVANGGCGINVYSNNSLLGQFGINGLKIFEININSTQVCNVDPSGNLKLTGGITMYSDIRKKTKLKDVELTLHQVADAPLIEHYYNDDKNKTTHVGSIAQYWANLNDWFCKEDHEGYYTMEIQNCALASAISIARELDRYETKTDKRIANLERENKELKEELKRLKA